MLNGYVCGDCMFDYMIVFILVCEVGVNVLEVLKVIVFEDVCCKGMFDIVKKVFCLLFSVVKLRVS